MGSTESNEREEELFLCPMLQGFYPWFPVVERDRVVGGTEEVGVGLCTHWCPPASLWMLHSSLESTAPPLHPTADCNIF